MIINIKQLPLTTIIGVWEFEKEIEQTLYLDASIKIDPERLIKSDDVEDTLNYFDLANKIQKVFSAKRFDLLESGANFIHELIMEEEIAESALIELHKPLALSNHGAKVSVTVGSLD